jgi:hypothetical protein
MIYHPSHHSYEDAPTFQLANEQDFSRAHPSQQAMKNKSTKEPYYVTWQDTFYPESASVSNGPPSSSPAGHVDRWGTVWAEARIIEDDDTSNSSHEKVVATDEESVVIPPTNVAEVGREDGDRLRVGQEGGPGASTLPSVELRNSLPNRHAAVAAAAQPLSHASSRKPCVQGHVLDIIAGTSLTITAVTAVVAIEVSAFAVYCLAAGFFQLCRVLERSSGSLPFLWIFYHVFLLTTVVLMMVDSVLLTVSVMITEILAAVTWFLCALLGFSCGTGSDWHQYVRRMCHFTRWAIRGIHHQWTPERRIFSYNLDTAGAQGSKKALPLQKQNGQHGSPAASTARPGSTVAAYPHNDPLAPAQPVLMD